MKDNNEVLKLFIVSDSIGEAAQRIIRATLTQFPDLTQVEVRRFPYIRDKQEFLNALQLTEEQNAVVVTTLVSESFNTLGHQFANERQISYIGYMSELISIIKQHTHAKPLMESGALRKFNGEYFKHIEAIEYSMKYDDGKRFTDIGEADALVVGVSRTSKTPLSMYLANKGYKVASIPLVPEVAIPDGASQQENLKVFGLTTSPSYITNVRRNRVEILGLSSESNYNSLERIKEELSYAEEIFRKLDAMVISTEYESIEESAFYIEKLLAKR